MVSVGSLLLVCGGRTFGDRACVRRSLVQAWAAGFRRLVCGGAKGADTLASEVGRELGFQVRVVPADWARFGRSAGPRRNQAMLCLRPACCLAFPGGRGTADMVARCRASGVRVVQVKNVEEDI